MDATTSAASESAAAKKPDQIVKLQPTLFIGVGGTGMEVLLRVRRHILNAVWGAGDNRIRVESLADFPVAEFINFDLAVTDVIEKDKAQASDPLFTKVKFTDAERLVETFDMEKYSRDDDSLGRYPIIQGWLPLTPQKIRELQIDPAKGAGQIRAISRLYFFDKFQRTLDLVRLKLKSLKNGLSKEQQLRRLGLDQAQEKFKIVVVCSVAGGTGSGSFLDMGWLTKWLGKTELPSVTTELMLFLPTGFSGANKERTEANGYAALMELEAAMRGGLVGRYVSSWDTYENPSLARKPYDDVYLVETGNLAQQHTADIKDIYQMVADALFEDFASADFANNKRAVAVNQQQHKISPLIPPVNQKRFGDMKLQYHKGYSAFGQSVLDTQQSIQREMSVHAWAGAMLKAFFGVGAADASANRANDKQRDVFMADYMYLGSVAFSDLPQFSAKGVKISLSSGAFNDYMVVEELLKDKQGQLVAGVQQKVDDRIEGIKAEFKREEWVPQVRDLVKQLERDAIRDQDSTADAVEDRITQQRKVLFGRVQNRVREQLYTYLDNHEFGGLEFVLTLVEQIKDKLANASTGLIAELSKNVARYQEIRDAVRTHEYERLLGNLAQTKGGLFGSGEKQAQSVMDHLKTEIANYLKFHLRSKAAQGAVVLMTDLSRWLGERTGVDAEGRPTWDGLVGEFQAGRESVLDMLGSLQQSIEGLRLDAKKGHATYIYVKAEKREMPLPSSETLREWANESFKDMGGSRQLFAMLKSPEDRNDLLTKVKRMAERQIFVNTDSSNQADQADPLFVALEQMSDTERQQCFSDMLARAMPWVDANFSDTGFKADQYKCYIGVAQSKAFAKRFKTDIDKVVPTQAGITAAQISIVETGVAGRAVCYCELAGIPLTVLRGIDAWRTSYRKENEKIPVHTHLDPTQFDHPLVPTPDELNRLADSFKQYVLAVMLGVMGRSPKRTTPPGLYKFFSSPGEGLDQGNEREFRKSGLPQDVLKQIICRVNDKLDELGKHQVAALAILAEYYHSHVYAPKVVRVGDAGREGKYKGFAYTLLVEVESELKARALRKGWTEEEWPGLKSNAIKNLRQWATPIEGSDADAYEWEVAEPNEESGPRLKYAVRKDLFEEGADELLARALGVVNQSQTVHGSVHAAALPGVAVAGYAAPPPLPPLAAAVQYQLGINGQQHGPYSEAHVRQFLGTGQINRETLIWHAGLSGWKRIGELPEFAAPPPLPVAAPPLPVAAPPLPGL